VPFIISHLVITRRDGMDEWLIIVKPDDGQRTDSRFGFTACRGFPLPRWTNSLGSVDKRISRAHRRNSWFWIPCGASRCRL